MAFCCGEETKLGADAKTPKIQHLVEDFPVAPEFLTAMSGQLQGVQQVMEEVNAKIAYLQDQINSKLSQGLPKEVTQLSQMSEKVSLPSLAGDLDLMAEQRGVPQERSPIDESKDEVPFGFQDFDQLLEDLREQFRRCDVSSNGWVSANELVALAFSHGEQLQLGGVLKLCTYLASSPSATRVSKRVSLVEEYEEEQMKKEFDLNGGQLTPEMF